METENITTDVVFDAPVETPVETPVDESEQKPVYLTDIEVNTSDMAFNIIVSFLSVAQKRGTFSINESAKIWECLKFFLTPEQLAGIKQ